MDLKMSGGIILVRGMTFLVELFLSLGEKCVFKLRKGRYQGCFFYLKVGKRVEIRRQI